VLFAAVKGLQDFSLPGAHPAHHALAGVADFDVRHRPHRLVAAAKSQQPSAAQYGEASRASQAGKPRGHRDHSGRSGECDPLSPPPFADIRIVRIMPGWPGRPNLNAWHCDVPLGTELFRNRMCHRRIAAPSVFGPTPASIAANPGSSGKRPAPSVRTARARCTGWGERSSPLEKRTAASGPRSGRSGWRDFTSSAIPGGWRWSLFQSIRATSRSSFGAIQPTPFG
jgi:hypothetical protein